MNFMKDILNTISTFTNMLRYFRSIKNYYNSDCINDEEVAYH